MKSTIALLALLLAVPAFAQQKPASTLPPTPPTVAAKPATPPSISDSERASFFKAQSQMIQANTQASARQADFQMVVSELQKTCGDKYTLQLNAGGDPECVAMPAPTPTK